MTQLTDYQDNRERQRAYERVRASGVLRPYADIIEALPEEEQDWQWIATAPEAEVLRWAEELRDHERDEIANDTVISPRDEDWQ